MMHKDDFLLLAKKIGRTNDERLLWTSMVGEIVALQERVTALEKKPNNNTTVTKPKAKVTKVPKVKAGD